MNSVHSHCNLFAVMFALYFSQSLLLYPTAAANEQPQLLIAPLPRFFHTDKIKTPAINKLLWIIWHWLFLYFVSSSALSLSFYIYIYIFPFFSPPPPQALLSGPRNLAHFEKHSWKALSPPDQGDFLIHSLLLLVFFFCVFCFVLCSSSLSSVHTALLLCFACVEVGKSIL